MKKTTNQKGFSIIEILITLFIIGVMMVLYYAALNSAALSKKLKNENLAYHSANKKMEELRGTPYDSLPPSGNFTDTSFSTGSGTFEVNSVAGFTGLKEIVVTVSWNDGIAKSVVIKSYSGSGGLNP